MQDWPNSLPASTLIPLPDVAEPMSETSANRAKVLRIECDSSAGKRPVIACVGRVARRKNVGGLLRALDSWVGVDRPFVLLAGECSESDLGDDAEFIRDWFLDPSHGHAQWGRVDDDDFDSYIAAADMVWACYSNFDGSSNMLAKAAQCGTCVLVNPGGAAAVVARSCAHAEVADTSGGDGLRRSIVRCLERVANVSSHEFDELRVRFGPAAHCGAIEPLTVALHRACRRG